MILLDDTGNKFESYEFTPNNKLIEEYKRETISKIPEEELWYMAFANDNKYNHILDGVDKELYYYHLYSNGHSLRKYSEYPRTFDILKNSKENEKVINDYCANKKTPNFYIIYVAKNKVYLNITRGYELNGSDDYIMKNILSLPEELYILSLLESFDLNKLNEYDYTKLLSLFNISKDPIGSVTKKELYNIVSKLKQIDKKLNVENKLYENYIMNSKLEKARNDQKVLTLAKKYCNKI